MSQLVQFAKDLRDCGIGNRIGEFLPISPGRGTSPAIPDKLYVIIGFNALTNSAQKKETQ